MNSLMIHGIWDCPFCDMKVPLPAETNALVKLMIHVLTDHPEEPLSGDIAKMLFKLALASLRVSDIQADDGYLDAT